MYARLYHGPGKTCPELGLDEYTSWIDVAGVYLAGVYLAGINMTGLYMEGLKKAYCIHGTVYQRGLDTQVPRGGGEGTNVLQSDSLKRRVWKC